jgi:hypothetical protein
MKAPYKSQGLKGKASDVIRAKHEHEKPKAFRERRFPLIKVNYLFTLLIYIPTFQFII